MRDDYRRALEIAESRQGLYRELVRRLQRKAPKNLEDEIRALHEEAFSQIDCLDCGNCCRLVGPRLGDLDVSRLAKALSMKRVDFEESYLKVDEDGDRVFREHPCPLLLEDNRCLVYESRPKACREYPHTDAKNVRGMLKLSLTNSRYCPVVAQVFEGLSKRYL
jgi:hypothetical protein